MGTFIQDYSYPIYPRAKWYIKVWAEIEPEKYEYLLNYYEKFYNELPEEHQNNHIIVWTKAFWIATNRPNPKNKYGSGPLDLYVKLEKVMNVEDLKKLPKKPRKSKGEQFGEYMEDLQETLPGLKANIFLLKILIPLFIIILILVILTEG